MLPQWRLIQAMEPAAKVIELSTAPEPLDSSAGTLEVPVKAASGSEPPPAPSSAAAATKTTPVQIVLIVLGTIAFLYFARPVVLPVFLAVVAGMALKPLIRWLSYCHIPPALSAAVVLCLLVAAVGIGFFELGRPAMTWMNDAPATHGRVEATGSENVPACGTLQPGCGCSEQPGSGGRRTEEGDYGGTQNQPCPQHIH